MPIDPITEEVSARICRHMNCDHKKTLIAFAKHYAGIRSATEVVMLNIKPTAMELEVDGKIVQIPFEHILTNSEDAHQTLIKMLKAIP